jgi:hypothetical protein
MKISPESPEAVRSRKGYPLTFDNSQGFFNLRRVQWINNQKK